MTITITINDYFDKLLGLKNLVIFKARQYNIKINLVFRHSMRKVPTVRPAVQAQSSYFTLTMTKKVYAPRE